MSWCSAAAHQKCFPVNNQTAERCRSCSFCLQTNLFCPLHSWKERAREWCGKFPRMQRTREWRGKFAKDKINSSGNFQECKEGAGMPNIVAILAPLLTIDNAVIPRHINGTSSLSLSFGLLISMGHVCWSPSPNAVVYF